MMVTPNEYAHTVTTVTISVCLSGHHQRHGIHTRTNTCVSVPTHCAVLVQKSTRIVRKCWQVCQSQGWRQRVATTAKIPFHVSRRSTNSVTPERISLLAHNTRVAG